MDRRRNVECIGSGGILGTYLADLYFNRGANVPQAVHVAVQMLQQVKRYDPYCGFASDIRYMDGYGRIRRLDDATVAALEAFLTTCIRSCVG